MADTMTGAAAPERFHALDAVRGGALMLGIVFHATMSFLPGAQMWIVMDDSRSATLAVVFHVLHIFRMTTFFLIAGFFAHMMFHRRGAKGFIVDRLKRIGLPLVVFWPILFGLIVVCTVWGAMTTLGLPLDKLPPPPKAPPGMLLAFPLTHLWFLYILLLLYAATLAVRAAWTALDRDGRLTAGVDAAVKAVGGSLVAPIVLAIPVTVLLATQPAWLAWFGIPTPDSSLIPNAPAFGGFFVAFGFGWLVHRQPQLLKVWEARWPVNLALALAATVGGLATSGVTPVVVPLKPGLEMTLEAGLYGLAVWSWTLAVIGMAQKFLSGHSPARRYVADASYWLYLIHLPIVMALQVALAKVDMAWWIKFPLILAIAFPLMFASYHVMVRRTWLGGWLNGKRAPKREKTQLPSPVPAAEPSA